MALSEFELISRYFNQFGLAADPLTHEGVDLGIGDDGALLSLRHDQQMTVSMDVLVEGVHFPAGADAVMLGERALAVNLSDLAAMGATPLGFTLGLTLPEADADWLAGFSIGLRDSALRHRCPLLGGDTTRGPRQIAIGIHGTLPKGTALLRSGARVGDDVFVSGVLGRAGLALSLFDKRFDKRLDKKLDKKPDTTLVSATAGQTAELITSFYLPQPRLSLGIALRGRASAAQDVSDGVLADLEHIARASRVGIALQAGLIPVAPVVAELCEPARALQLALTAGDDYELVFTAPPAQRAGVQAAALSAGVSVTRIGRVVAGEGVVVLDNAGLAVLFPQQGYQHF